METPITKTLRIVLAGLAFSCSSGLAHAQANPTRLRLTDALDLALTANPQRKTSMLRAKQAAANHAEVQARFDLSVFSSFGYERGASSTQGTQNMLATGFSRGSFEVGVQKPFPFGASLEFRFGAVKSRNAIALPSPTGPTEVQVQEYFVQPRVTYRQSILQNAGTRVGKAPIRKAKAQLESQQAKQAQQTINTIRDVTLAYWDLKAAQLNLEACHKARSLVTEQIATTKIQIQEGRRAQRDLLALEQELSVKDMDLQEAQTQVYDRGVDLGLLMGLGTQPKAGQQLQAVEPLQEPSPDQVISTPATSLSFESHPEVRALAATVESLRQELVVAQNQRKPVLDAYLAAGTRGLSRDAVNDLQARQSGSWKDAWRNFFSDDAPPRLVDYSLEAGLELKWSPRNRSARARARKAKLDLEAANLQLATARQGLVARLRKATQLEASLRARWNRAQSSVELAQQNLEVERERFRAGYATNDDLLLRINELYQAQRRRGQVHINWIKSKVQYTAIAANLGRSS